VLGDFRVLRQRAYRYLFLAQTISLLGSAVSPVGLAFAILDSRGGTASQLGFVLGARSLGMVAFLLLGGVLADRLPRFRLMATANLIAFGTQSSMAAMFLSGHAPTALVAALAFGNGAAAALFLPALTGVVPQLVDADQLQPANALLRLSRNSTSIIGTALGGVLVVAAGAGWALAFDAVTFAIGAGLLLAVRVGNISRASPGSMLADLRAGWQEFRSRAWVWLLVGQYTIVNGTYAAINVLGPLLARQYMGGAPAWAGILTAMAVGLVAGSLVAIRLRPGFPLRFAAIATFGFVPPFFMLAFHAPVWLVAAAMLVNGVCVDVFEVLWATSLQQHIPNESLSRISSYDALGSFVLGPWCLMLAGPLAQAVGVRTTLLGAGLLLTAVTVIPVLARPVRMLPGRPAAPDAADAAAGHATA
jgi:MFS family permease